MKERKTPWQCDSVGTVTLPATKDENVIKVDHINIILVNGVVHVQGSLDKEETISLLMSLALELEEQA